MPSQQLIDHQLVQIMMMNIARHKARDKQKMIRTMILQEIMLFIPIGTTVAVQQEDDGLWTHGTIVGKGIP